MPLLNKCLHFKGKGKDEDILHKASCSHYLGIVYSLKSAEFYDPIKLITYHGLAVKLDPFTGYHKALEFAVVKFNADNQNIAASLAIIESEISKLELEILGNIANEDSSDI